MAWWRSYMWADCLFLNRGGCLSGIWREKKKQNHWTFLNVDSTEHLTVKSCQLTTNHTQIFFFIHKLHVLFLTLTRFCFCFFLISPSPCIRFGSRPPNDATPLAFHRGRRFRVHQIFFLQHGQLTGTSPSTCGERPVVHGSLRQNLSGVACAANGTEAHAERALWLDARKLIWGAC